MANTVETMTAAEFADAFGLEPDEVREVDLRAANVRVVPFGEILDGLRQKIARGELPKIAPFAPEPECDCEICVSGGSCIEPPYASTIGGLVGNIIEDGAGDVSPGNRRIATRAMLGALMAFNEHAAG
jgi:hypothetical protein